MARVFLLLALATALQAGQLQLGDALALDRSTKIVDLLSSPEDYVGKTVQVKGKVTEVCQMMGCWMMLRDDADNMVRIKVNDGDIVFPKESPGQQATAEGKFVSIELSHEQALAAAKHEADEQGRKFDPSKVKGPQTIYQIQGSGAVVVTD